MEPLWEMGGGSGPKALAKSPTGRMGGGSGPALGKPEVPTKKKVGRIGSGGTMGLGGNVGGAVEEADAEDAFEAGAQNVARVAW